MTAASFPEGTVLTCTHEGTLRVPPATSSSLLLRRQAGATYTCSCGTPMVVVAP